MREIVYPDILGRDHLLEVQGLLCLDQCPHETSASGTGSTSGAMDVATHVEWSIIGDYCVDGQIETASDNVGTHETGLALHSARTHMSSAPFENSSKVFLSDSAV